MNRYIAEAVIDGKDETKWFGLETPNRLTPFRVIATLKDRHPEIVAIKRIEGPLAQHMN